MISNLKQLDEVVAKQLGYVKYPWTADNLYFDKGTIIWLPPLLLQWDWSIPYKDKYGSYEDLESYSIFNDRNQIPDFSTDLNAAEEILQYIINQPEGYYKLYELKDSLLGRKISCFMNVEGKEGATSTLYSNQATLPLVLCLTFLKLYNIPFKLQYADN